MLVNLISIPIFITALAFGIFLVYIFKPAPNIIYVYPTPENVGKLQYKDNSGTCFSFASEKVKCPKDGVKEIPVQTSN